MGIAERNDDSYRMGCESSPTKHGIPGTLADLLQELAVDHPFAAVLSLVGGVGLFVFLLQKCYAKNPRPTDSEKSAGLRLD